MNGTVEVVNHTRVPLDTRAVAELVEAVLAAEGTAGGEVGVTFVGARRMRALNREHRGRDAVTDVLAFPLEDADGVPQGGTPSAPDAPPRLLGDVVVCARQALRQARAAGLPPEAELALLLVHGTLHLLGYDHEADAGRMAVRQTELLQTLPWERLRVAAR